MVDPSDKKFLELCLAKHLLDKQVAVEVYQRARRDERSVAEVLIDMGVLPQHTIDALRREMDQALTPKSIAGFRIIRKLGQGGMGSVYLAEQISLKRQVALKVIAPQFAADTQAVDRFMREARSAAAINHPNIISVIDVGYDSGHLFMALELVSGGDAAQLAARFNGVLPEVRALEIICDCCRGLGALYEARLIHRDIKPANIFITRDGIAKLADLGLARSEQGDDRLTMSGHAIGTPAFMSPEQASGKSAIDIRSDVYSLGAALFALTTGSPPFTGEGVFAIAAKLLTEPAPDPRSLNPTLSAATAQVVARCLAKQPADRFQTPHELSVAIAEALTAVSGSTGARLVVPSKTPPTSDGRLHPTPATVQPRKPRPPVLKRPPRSAHLPIIGGIIAVMAVVVVIGMTWNSRKSDLGHLDPSPPAPVAIAPVVNPTIRKVNPPVSELSQVAGPVTGPSPRQDTLVSATAPSVVTSTISGLIAYWPLDEGSGFQVRDLSGHKSTSTISNATWIPGKVAGGLSFSPPSKVDCGNAAILMPATGITVMCWIKSTMMVTDWKFVSVIRHEGHFNALQLFANGNAKTAIWSGGNVKIFDFLWRGVWDDGIWHHFAVTCDGKDGVRIFKDGKNYATEINIVGNLAPSSSNPFMLGAAETNTEYFSGSLDEVRVYDHALTAAEIQTLAAPATK